MDWEFWTLSRVASICVAAVEIGLVAIVSGGEGAFRLAAFLLLPLLCVWFPEVTGRWRGMRMDRASPPVFVFILGWLLLFVPVVLLLSRFLR